MQQRLEALLEARDSGALTVRHGDKSVTYRSDSEMAAAIASLEDRISAAQGLRPSRIIYPRTSKGY
ncbi:hypothetical protein JHX88_09955 [Paracoccus saliphilus]|nr:hypothetical protein JHX88_09955 [Paracoccus saliphilus]